VADEIVVIRAAAAQRVLEGIYVQTNFYLAREVTGQKLAVLKSVSGMIP